MERIENKARQYAERDDVNAMYKQGRYIGYYSGYVDGVSEAIGRVKEATQHLTIDEQQKIAEALLSLYEN